MSLRTRSAHSIPADAFPGLAFNQVINSLRSRAGTSLLAKSTSGVLASGEIGIKSFNTSYGSE